MQTLFDLKQVYLFNVQKKKITPLDHTLSQMNPVHVHAPYTFKPYFNIILIY
jgi:hypothetical protein